MPSGLSRYISRTCSDVPSCVLSLWLGYARADQAVWAGRQATLADREISAQVNERVEGYWRGCRDARRYEGQVGAVLLVVGPWWVEADVPARQVAVVFSHRKSRKTWFTSSEEDVPFEVHLIVLREGSPASPAGAGAGAETRAKEELASALGQILRFCAERTRQVPAISSGVVRPLSVGPGVR